MKKLIVLFIALALCLGAVTVALAEEEEIPRVYWSEKADEAAERDGDFYTLNQLGLRFWAPAYMELQELTDAQRERNNIARFMNAEETDFLVITLNESDRTYDDVYNLVQERGMEVHKAYLNDLPVVIYRYVRDDGSASNCAAFVTNDGHVLEFVFTGDDITFREDSEFILYSIQQVETEEPEPMEPDVPAYWWENYADGVSADDGIFYTLNRVGLDIWIPAYMSISELSEEAIQQGFIVQFLNEDHSCEVGITLVDQGTTYDEYYDILVSYGVEEIYRAYTNDLPVIVYHFVRSESSESNVIAIVTDDGQVLEFIFTGTDEAFVDDCGRIGASIQLTESEPEAPEPTEPDIPTFYWEDSAAELEAAGIEGSLYKLNNVDAIVWMPSFLEPRELTESDLAADCIANFTSEDGSYYVSVTLPKLGVNFRDGLELLKKSNVRNISEAKINDFYVALYSYTDKEGGEHNSVVVFFDDGFALNLDFTGGDQTFDEYCRYIVKSLQREK